MMAVPFEKKGYKLTANDFALFHWLASNHGRFAHEIALGRLDSPGETLHSSVIVFDLLALKFYNDMVQKAREEAEARARRR